MLAEIVTAAVMIGSLLCFIHGWMHRERWLTAAFFIGGFIFGVVRENIVALMPGMYSYPDHAFYIGAAPMVMWFGWSVSFYASWVVGNRILEALAPKWKDNLWAILLTAAVITAFISLPVEIAAGAPETGWWIWPPEAIPVWYEMPPIVPFGWGGAAFLFLLFFLTIEKRDAEPRTNALVFIAASLLVTILHLVYTFAIRSIIVLLIG